MSGITLEDVLFLITSIEVIILNGLVFMYLMLPKFRKDRLKLHFALLVALYATFNFLTIYLPDSILLNKGISLVIINGSCSVIVAFFLNYLMNRVGNEETKFIHPKAILLFLFGCFFSGVLVAQFFIGFIEHLEILITPIPLILTLVLVVGLQRQIKVQKDSLEKGELLLLYSGFVSILLTAALPFVASLGEIFVMNILFINVTFLLTMSAFLYRISTEFKRQDKFLDKRDDLSKYNLTDRQLEVLQLILDGYSYKEIASKLFLAEGTIRKHASDAFDKLGIPVRNRKGFIEKFGAF